MSRSNPQVNAPNPAVCWFEWNGEHGKVRHYDKAAKQNVESPLPFTFLLLDELASVRGWHDLSESGIYSNAVRDTRTDMLVVKSFKEGTLAEGLYKDIKDRINRLGGQFVANCYIGFKQNGSLAIAVLQLKGSALGAWMEFRKAHRGDLYSKAINITGYQEGKKGRIVFRTPTFDIKDTSEDTNAQAVKLDKQLQDWLTGYFARRTNDQTEPEPEAQTTQRDEADYDDPPVNDSDIPF